MKNLIFALFCLVIMSSTVKAQNVAVSFSYFFPKDGYPSVPVSPFSIRGIGVDLNDYLAIQTGGSLYLMSGMQITDLPLESSKPLSGPSFTVMVPVELFLSFQSNKFDYNIKGGVFGFFNIWQKLNTGNFDRAIRSHENWEVANSDLDFKKKPGWGFHGGPELVFYPNNKYGISLEFIYYLGGANMPITGNYKGGNSGEPLQTVDVNYEDAILDYTGFEISIGVIIL
ncbi:hypothetical protein [Mangrovivirga cuniculi]|uniref:Outer membrane protein beta-barrel domain-containing protein n=1 Tax=Mangrovivirga cuniculi TaxID=2715131 RepID=A0A4D7JS90_9BACT|nr:hypothetical protein [Mangrovivirga cuniculi]QCK16380.1 hypothetical protein DCC35_17380 [Mangrovivirga cuniculi]